MTFARPAAPLAGALLLIGLLALAAPRPAAAATVAPPVTPFVAYLYPPGAQAGTTVELTATGQNLQGAATVRVFGTGLTATVVKVVNPTTVTLSATVAPDAQPGLREIRLITPGGASNRVRFAVGQLPELREKEPNSEPAQAEQLDKLPVLVNGQLMEGDRDYFRFAATAGQTIVCQVQARTLLPFIADAVPGWNDPVLTLYDAAGRQLQCVDDFRLHPDPVLIFKAPRDGQYVLEIKDVLYRGRGDFFYRLSVGQLPYVTHVFPLGGRRGASSHLALSGVNLPVGGLDLPIAGDAPALLHVGVAAQGLASNQLPFAVGDYPEATEVEPNDAATSAPRVAVPSITNGRIGRAGDVDHYTFAVAAAGEKFVLEIRARRLGSPLDAALAVFDAKGRKVVEIDDIPDPAESLLTHHADPRILFTAPAKGDYVVRVRDVQNKGGDEFAYRLTVAPPRPDYQLRASPDNPRVGRGDAAMLTVTAIRTDGFNAPIDLAVSDLPAGYVASRAAIPAGQTQAYLTITAPADAPLAVLSPTITGAAPVGDPKATPVTLLTRRATGAEQAMQAFSINHIIPTEDLLLTVIDGSGFTLALDRPVPDALQIPQGGEVTLDVRVVRRPEVKGGISLKPAASLRGVTIRPSFIPADQDKVTLTLAATRTAAPGPVTLVLTGTLRAGKETILRTLPAVPLNVVAVPVTPATPAAGGAKDPKKPAKP